jgi:hypothetical protein
MWRGISAKAKAIGLRPRAYLGQLIAAAYTARVCPQGDREMEAAVQEPTDG